MDNPFFKTFGETKVWLDSVGLTDYTIHDDLTVDVGGGVNLAGKVLTTIPVRFGVVSGGFNCGHNQLTGLNGAPTRCVYLICKNNLITSLDGVITECEHFNCGHNQLTGLAGAAVRCQYFHCNNNQITSLDESLIECLFFYGGHNRLTSLDGAPKFCKYLDCTDNPELLDVSGAPDSCVLDYDYDVVAKNQAARQLSALETGAGVVLAGKSRRIL